MKRGVLRTLAVCAAIALGGSLAAAESYTYIMVLKDRVPAGEQAEPDVEALGGEVLHRSRNRRVVRVPAEAARSLAAHRAVSYMQRVQTGGEVPALPQSPMIALRAVETNDSTPPTWESGDYVYDGDGNITAIGADTYAYDSASRLVNASLTDGATQSEGYEYDSFGNLVYTTRSATPSTSTPASKATNRLTNVTYDSAGNVATSESGTTQYFYDGFNMLRFMDTSAPGTGIYYVYTAGDERVGVDDYGEKRWMIRDLSGKVLREWEPTNGPWWIWREDYVYRGGALVAAERETAEGGTRHFHIDHLGTARLITDQSKQKIAHHDYFPFGVEKTDFRQEMLDRGTHWPNAMKFTGHERDFIGGTSTNNRNQLDYMHARYYSAVWGRFLSPDPIYGRLRTPQGWNRYAYVLNNPMLFVDPTGMAKQGTTGATITVEGDSPETEERKRQEQRDREFQVQMESMRLQRPKSTEAGLAALSHFMAHPSPASWRGVLDYPDMTEFLLIADDAVMAIEPGMTIFQAGVLGGSTGGAPVGYVDDVVVVSRWGRAGLQSGDWVMRGRASWWNYFWSGKWQPGFGNQFARFATGQEYRVLRSALRWPRGFGVDGWIKGLLGQCRYMP